LSDKDKRPDGQQPDYDLTTPFAYPQQGGPTPPQPGGPDDRTTINRPFPPHQEKRSERPGPPQQNQNPYDLTMVNFGVPIEDEEEAAPPPTRPLPPYPPAQPQYAPAQQQYAAQPQPAPVRQQQPRQSRSKLPIIILIALVLILLLGAGGALAYYFLSSPPSFTLRVLNAPAGSKVFIDDIPSGVPQRDGSIIVQGLRAGEPRDVRVTQEGYAEWRTSVTGKNGETLDVTANMTPLQQKPAQPAQPATLPAQIDYSGTMMLVAAGPFTMGADGGNLDEAPAHTVDVPAFYIDKLEVTNEQYAKFCDATGHARPTDPFWDPNYFEKNPHMPVIGVGHDDAEAYATWAGKRLPTEAEWEKAASWGPGATTKRKYPWGDAVESGRANLSSQHPTDVGSMPTGASAYGVMDMAGNAREWVSDAYAPYPGSASANPNYGKGYRVVRGGDFRAGPNFARTTSRLGVDPAFKTNPGDEKLGRSSLVGFRCAISADDPKLKTVLGK
jgi:formylglycine-generating enzyme required for sulfatase activity